MGHTIEEVRPSLTPLRTSHPQRKYLDGLLLKNIQAQLIVEDEVVREEFGEISFSDRGIEGAVALRVSRDAVDALIDDKRVKLVIDMKPALDHKTLDSRILSDFSEFINKDFINSLDALLPQKMIPIVVGLSGIDGRKKVNSITKEEREALVSLIKNIEIPISDFRPINEAIITKGGVSVSEVSPKTMESKLAAGLYFAGEVLDLDAYTGGFNLQIAFSTATLACENAAWSSFE